MCDWEAEEYAEYLLWAETQKARARARANPPREVRVLKTLTSVVLSPEPVEA